MDVGPYIAVGLIVILTAAGNVLFPNRAKRTQRALGGLPRARIDTAHGAVRVTGRIRRDDELLEAPITGRPCVAYELAIHAGSQNTSTGMSGWRRLLHQQQACPFLVADESGTARIDTSAPFVLGLVCDYSGKTSGAYPGKYGAVALFLESVGIKPTNWLGRWGPIYYEEGVLVEGDLVAVGGDTLEQIDASGDRTGLRSAPTRLVLRGTEAQPLLIAKD
jgi:hypothetical protein